ncbi:MAG: hypothetical protein ACRENP_06030 [Longimicrobiales bacterium]
MKKMTSLLIMLVVGLLLFFAAIRQKPRVDDWTTQFAIEPDELSTVGRNAYFILEPGHRLVLENGNERLIITVLGEIKRVGSIDTRVIEERETVADQLIEISRNYFAISKRTNSVFYFGEDVDVYRNGQVVGHEGAWLDGVNGARFGMMMPGVPLLRSRYYQELAPGQAMDRAEIVSLTDTLTTTAGNFRGLLKVLETTPLEPGVREFKYYAPGVGLVRDGSLRLVTHGMSQQSQ